MHELHARKAPIDAVASYLMLIDQYDTGTAAAVPCPRCYADGSVHALVMASADAGPQSGQCDACRATYDFRAQH